MGLLELAYPAVDGPGKGPFFIAEQLGLQQGLGNGDAVNDQKGFGRPEAVLIDGPGHQFLAGARIAPDQHRGVGGRHPADGLIDLLHGFALADDGIRGRGIRGHVQFHPGAHEAPRLQGLGDQGQDIRNLGGLEDVFEGPQLGGLDGGIRGAEGGHDDDRQLGLDLVDGPEGLQAAHPRHAHIHDHQVRELPPGPEKWPPRRWRRS